MSSSCTSSEVLSLMDAEGVGSEVGFCHGNTLCFSNTATKNPPVS